MRGTAACYLETHTHTHNEFSVLPQITSRIIICLHVYKDYNSIDDYKLGEDHLKYKSITQSNQHVVPTSLEMFLKGSA